MKGGYDEKVKVRGYDKKVKVRSPVSQSLDLADENLRIGGVRWQRL